MRHAGTRPLVRRVQAIDQALRARKSFSSEDYCEPVVVLNLIESAAIEGSTSVLSFSSISMLDQLHKVCDHDRFVLVAGRQAESSHR
jgi:hypothetical protein